METNPIHLLPFPSLPFLLLPTFPPFLPLYISFAGVLCFPQTHSSLLLCPLLLSTSRFKKKITQSKMSRRINGTLPKLELKLNLSPPRPHPLLSSPSRSATVSPTSPPSSCVSSELNQDDAAMLRYSSSPEATSMVLVGCPRCLMYVMLSENDPKCPKCKSSVLLDFLHHESTAAPTTSAPPPSAAAARKI